MKYSKRPQISVLVVTRNAVEKLHYTIDNLLTLEYENIEIIVQDGASTDGTIDYLKTTSEPVKWESKPDGGIYDAMNRALERASGDYVWYVNAGDRIWSTRVLDSVDGTADIYYGETLISSPQGEILGLRKKRLPKHLTWKSFLRGMVVCHQSILVRREIAPRYDLSYKTAADIEWVIASLRRANKIVNMNRVVSVFELGGESTRNRSLALKERFKIMCRNFGLLPTVAAHIGFVFGALTPRFRRFTE
jgi:glycosyltransferase involved in cell wall biosynthesis